MQVIGKRMKGTVLCQVSGSQTQALFRKVGKASPIPLSDTKRVAEMLLGLLSWWTDSQAI